MSDDSIEKIEFWPSNEVQVHSSRSFNRNSGEYVVEEIETTTEVKIDLNQIENLLCTKNYNETKNVTHQIFNNISANTRTTRENQIIHQYSGLSRGFSNSTEYIHRSIHASRSSLSKRLTIQQYSESDESGGDEIYYGNGIEDEYIKENEIQMGHCDGYSGKEELRPLLSKPPNGSNSDDINDQNILVLIKDFLQNPNMSPETENKLLAFLESIVTPNFKENYLYEVIFISIMKRHMEFFSALLPHCPNMNFVDERFKESILHLAVRYKNLDMVKKILECQYVDVNNLNLQDESALHIAAENNSPGIIRLLLAKGANRFQVNKDTQLPIHMAALKGNASCCTELLSEYDEEQLNEVTANGDTPLACSSSIGSLKCCEILFKDTIKDKINNDGNSALHCASLSGQWKIVTFLLKKGSNYKLKNKDGNIPAFLSASLPTKETLEKLCNFDMKYYKGNTIRNNKGQTLIHVALPSLECLRFLLTFLKDSINSIDGNRKTPLEDAIQSNNEKAAKYLSDMGAKSFIKKSAINNLFEAVKRNMPDVCRSLLDKEPWLITELDPDKRNALHIAVQENKYECCEVLVKFVDKDYSDINGHTPLHLAADCGFIKICTLLLRHNFSTIAKDNELDTPLQLATRNDDLETCKVLLEESKEALVVRNKEGLIPIDTAFYIKSGSIFSYFLPQYENENIDLYSSLQAHYVFHRLLEDNWEESILGMIRSRYWKAAFGVYERDSDPYKPGESGCNYFENDKKDFHNCKNFRVLVIQHPELVPYAMDKCVDTTDECNVFNYDLIEGTIHGTLQNENYEDVELNPVAELKQKVKKISTSLRKDEKPFEKKRNWKELIKKKLNSFIPKESKKKREHVVYTMVSFERLELLKHPLINSWFNEKWVNAKVVHIVVGLLLWKIMNLILCCYLMMISWNWTLVKRSTNVSRDQFCTGFMLYDSLPKNGSNVTEEMTEIFVRLQSTNYEFLFLAFLIFLSVLCQWIHDIIILYRIRDRFYLISFLNSLLVVIIQNLHIFTIIPFNNCDALTNIRQTWQWELGIIALFLSWMQVLNGLNGIPSFSVFLPITGKFIKAFIKVLLTIAIIVFAFSIIFYLNLYRNASFSNIPQSMMKTTMWLRGDLAYDDTFVTDQLDYPVFTNIIFLLFVTTVVGFISNMILSNPLNTVDRYRERAELYKYKLAVDLCIDIEVCYPFKKRRLESSEEKKNLNKWLLLFNPSKGNAERLSEEDQLRNIQAALSKLEKRGFNEKYFEYRLANIEEMLKDISHKLEYKN